MHGSWPQQITVIHEYFDFIAQQAWAQLCHGPNDVRHSLFAVPQCLLEGEQSVAIIKDTMLEVTLDLDKDCPKATIISISTEYIWHIKVGNAVMG